MKNKRGLELNYLGWMIIGIALLFFASIIIFSNKSAISGILSGLKF